MYLPVVLSHLLGHASADGNGPAVVAAAAAAASVPIPRPVLDVAPEFRGRSHFSCDNYGGDVAPTEFCRQTACEQYCATSSHPEYCMELVYAMTRMCKQTAGLPVSDCVAEVGSDRVDLVTWCRTDGCEFARKVKPETPLGVATAELFPAYCRNIGTGTVPGPTTTSTTSPTTTSTTTTSPTTTSTTTKSLTTTTTTTTSQTTTTTTTTMTTTTTTTRTTTTTTTTTTPESEGGCWAATNWSPTAECKQCPGVTGDKCSAWTWTQCYGSKAACQAGSEIDGTMGACKETCEVNTRGLTRPKFEGPNCYDSQYGSSFGPNWAPSGKTAFEELVPNPTALRRIVSYGVTNKTPLLGKQWRNEGCAAAVAMYENIVCAIELTYDKTFEAVAGGPGYTGKDFLNGDDLKLRHLELAAFLAHQGKETGRYSLFEEATPNAYCADSTEFPCVAGKSYRGRGPIQISYNFNYGPFSQWFFGSKDRLLQNPEFVDPEGPMGYVAALWFWMTPRQYSAGPVSGTIRTRDAIIHWTDGKMNDLYRDGKNYDSVAGLGLSTDVINGGIECSGNRSPHAARVAYFLTLASRLGVDIANYDNPSQCENDPLCAGLWRGCIRGAGTCTPKKEKGCLGSRLDFVDNWTILCK